MKITKISESFTFTGVETFYLYSALKFIKAEKSDLQPKETEILDAWISRLHDQLGIQE